MKKPNIFNFHEYRVFIKAWLSYLKESQGASLRSISKEISCSASYLSMMISGERKINKSCSEKLTKLFSLNDRESQYFLHLIKLSDSNKASDKKKALASMQRYTEYKRKNTDEVELHNYLDKWYHVAIRELISGSTKPTHLKDIVEKLKPLIGMNKLKASLKFLSENGYLYFDTQSLTYSTQNKHISCMDGVYKVSLASFHQQMFEKAIESIYEHNSQERIILGHTSSITEKQFSKIKKNLESVLQETEEIASEPQNDTEPKKVYHIGLSCFPVIK